MQKITVLQKDGDKFTQGTFITENVTKLKETVDFITVIEKKKIKHPNVETLNKVIDLMGISKELFYLKCDEVDE